MAAWIPWSVRRVGQELASNALKWASGSGTDTEKVTGSNPVRPTRPGEQSNA
jgi:hypothetical protein